MIPTIEELVLIALAIVIVLIVPRLPDIGDALGRLFLGPRQ